MDLLSDKKFNFIMGEAIKEINSRITVWRKIIHFFYYLFYKIFPYYSNKVSVQVIKISDNVNVIEKYNDSISVHSIGFHIDHIFVPYEYMVRIDGGKNIIDIELFGRIQNGTIFYCKSTVIVRIIGKNMKKLQFKLMDNLYYHMKYNKINKEAAFFFDLPKKIK
jgi:hypothetical protein